MCLDTGTEVASVPQQRCLKLVVDLVQTMPSSLIYMKAHFASVSPQPLSHHAVSSILTNYLYQLCKVVVGPSEEGSKAGYQLVSKLVKQHTEQLTIETSLGASNGEEETEIRLPQELIDLLQMTLDVDPAALVDESELRRVRPIPIASSLT